jgi:hypothetical protein
MTPEMRARLHHALRPKHPTAEKRYQCPYCKKKYSEEGRLDRHVKKHEQLDMRWPNKKRKLDALTVRPYHSTEEYCVRYRKAN